MIERIVQGIDNPLLLILFVGAWLAVFTWIINIIFDALIRYIISKTTTKADDKLAPIIKNIFVVGIVVTVLYFTTLYLDLGDSNQDFLSKVFLVSMAGYFTYAGIKISNIIFGELNRKTAHQGGEKLHSVVPFMNNLANIAILSIGVLFILRLFSVDITPALASAGVVGIAVAFAAKDFVANLFGGLSVFFDQPYLIGDYVIIADQYRGEVMEIGMRSTKIKTRDNVLLTVPNSVMVTNTVINETGYEPQLRVRIPLQVHYNTDLAKAEKILGEVGKKHKDIISSYDPRVRYRSFGESGIDLEFLFVIKKPADRGRVVHEVVKQIHLEFKKGKINIPYPQRDIHISK